MKKIYTIIISIIAILAVNAETVTLSPISDTYTDVEHPSESPVLTELWTANFTPAGMFQRIVIDFDLNDVLQSNVTHAELNLTRFFSCPSSGSTITKIYPITEEWNESSCNPHSHLAYDVNIYQEVPFIGTGGSSIVQFNIDITQLINDIQDSEIDFHGFVIIANSGQKFSKFYSKEYSNEDYRPNLSIDYSPVANAGDAIELTSLKADVYPNPFNPTTTISFSNSSNNDVTISIFDLRGRLIKKISHIDSKNGENSITWNGKDYNNKEVSSGIYFARVDNKNEAVTKKLILQK